MNLEFNELTKKYVASFNDYYDYLNHIMPITWEVGFKVKPTVITQEQVEIGKNKRELYEKLKEEWHKMLIKNRVS